VVRRAGLLPAPFKPHYCCDRMFCVSGTQVVGDQLGSVASNMESARGFRHFKERAGEWMRGVGEREIFGTKVKDYLKNMAVGSVAGVTARALLGADIAGSAGAGALSGAAREYLKLRKESISNASWSSGELAPASADERRLQKLKEEVKARWRVEKRVWDEVDKRKLRNAALRGALTGALGGAVGGFVVQHAPELIHNVGQAVNLLKESVKGGSLALGLLDKFVVEKAGKVSGTLWRSTREMLSRALGGSATNDQVRQAVGAII